MARIHAQAFAAGQSTLDHLYAREAVPGWMPGIARHDYRKAFEHASVGAYYQTLRATGQLGVLEPHWPALSEEQTRTLEATIAQLDARSFAAREAASKALATMGPSALTALRQQLATQQLTNEQRQRIEQLVLEDWVPYLNIAIHYYQRAIECDDRHLDALLGLAWAFEAAGDLEPALTSYRRTVKAGCDATLAAGRRSQGMDPDPSDFALEAANRLFALLPADASDERQALKNLLIKVKQLPVEHGPITPVLLPLGPRTDYAGQLDRRRFARFDLAGLGQTRRWHWISEDAGLLVWDPRHRGIVTSGRHLFGNRTWNVAWRHGYEPLALLDDNHDGILCGAELDGLAIWRDRGRPGLCEVGEIQPLTAIGIIEIGCQPSWFEVTTLQWHVPTRQLPWPASFHSQPIPWCNRGARFTDGRIVPSYDWHAEPVTQPRALR
jgi:hypothetical protein